MTPSQYLLLIHGNAQSTPTSAEWDDFFNAAKESGQFKGGSALGEHLLLGNQQAVPASQVAGCMQFVTDDREKLLALLEKHPTVLHGGTIELCEMPKT